MKTFMLEIQTPEKKIFYGEVVSLTALATDGEIGILPDHAPLATSLSAGPIRYQLESGEEKKQELVGGFLIVKSNRANVLLSKLAF